MTTTETSDAVAYCLERVGKKRAGWDTLVVGGASETTIPAETLWSVWSDLEQWPAWSPLHKRVTRGGSAKLTSGATFSQQIGLGFPVGTTTELVTVSLLEPDRLAAWEGHANGIRNCHLWSFTPLSSGGTHVSNVEGFSGLPVALLRPMVAHRWNRAFQDAVDGLVRRAADSS